MIYKLQRLYAEKDNNSTKPEKQEKKKTDAKYKSYNSVDESERGVREFKYSKDKGLAGNTSFTDEDGERYTRERLDHEVETMEKNIEELRKDEKLKAKLKRQEARKEKFNKAKDKTVKWAKKNKKGLIIGGSVLAAGTGAAIVGSKIHEKNKQNKIKEDVRGYSDVED